MIVLRALFLAKYSYLDMSCVMGVYRYLDMSCVMGLYRYLDMSCVMGLYRYLDSRVSWVCSLYHVQHITAIYLQQALSVAFMNILVVKCLIPKPFRALPNPLKKMYLTRLAKKALIPTFNKNSFDASKSGALAELVTQIHGLREKLTKELEEHYSAVQAEYGFLPSKSVIERWGPASETMTQLVHQYHQGRYDQDLGYGPDTLPKTANDWLCTAKKNYTQSAKVSKEKAEKEAQMLVLATVAEAEKKKQLEDAKKKKLDEVALKEKKETDMLKATYIRIVAAYVRDWVNEHAHVTWVKGAQPLMEVIRIKFV